jgi:hypothetical protein
MWPWRSADTRPSSAANLSAILALSWTAASFVTAYAGREWAQRSILVAPALVALGQMLTGCALILGSFLSVALALVLVGGGIGVAWAHLRNLMMAHARETERDVSSAFISTNQLIAQAFASALAGMFASLGGFADATSGSTGVVRAVSWVFLSFSLMAAAALPASVKSVRLSAEQDAVYVTLNDFVS